MKKSKLALALTAMFMFSGVTLAGDTTGLTFGGGAGPANNTTNNWTEAAGVITFVCPTGFTCASNPISDSNFLQVQMTDNSGNMYFRTIIAETVGTNSFTSENYVAAGAGNGGILAKQSLTENTLVSSGNLQSDTTLVMGSFNNGTEDTVILAQGIGGGAAVPSPTFYTGFNFNKTFGGATTTTLSQQIVELDAGGNYKAFADGFSYSQSKDNAGVVTSTALDVVSGVNLNGASGTVTDQAFSYSFREGSAVAAAGSASYTNGTSVSWVAGEPVAQTLIGQSVTGAGDFGYDAVKNNGTSTNATDFSLAALAPLGSVTASPFVVSPDANAVVVTTVGL